MNILITGCRGFIGGSLGRFAVRNGHRVLGTGRPPLATPNWPASYVQVADGTADLTAAIETFAPDVLIHAAGSSSVAASVSDPEGDFNASVSNFNNVLEAIRRSSVRPSVVLISSAAVIGNPKVLPVLEDAEVKPVSPYGFHKAMCELLAREYSECFGMKVLVCRLFSVFGFAQRRLLVWELYHQLAGSSSTAWINGTGSESRDFLHIEDVASAILGLLSIPSQPDTDYVTVNVASGVETIVADLAEMMRSLVAPQKEILCKNIVRKNDPYRWCADTTLLHSLLPLWKPRPLKESLAICMAEWSQNSEHVP